MTQNRFSFIFLFQIFVAEQLDAFHRVVLQLLSDVQERLVYRAHIYVQNDIIGYKPVSGDLAYPEKLEMMEVMHMLDIMCSLEFNSDIVSFFPSLILSSFYRVSRKDFKIRLRKVSFDPFPSRLSRPRIQFVPTLEVMLHDKFIPDHVVTPMTRTGWLLWFIFALTRWAFYTRNDADDSAHHPPSWPWPIFATRGLDSRVSFFVFPFCSLVVSPCWRLYDLTDTSRSIAFYSDFNR